MIFITHNHSFKYELEKLCRLFLPFEKFEFYDNETDILNAENYVFTGIDGLNLSVKLHLDGKYEQRTEKIQACENFEKTAELKLALMLFDCFYKITGYKTPWGILTGVRPAKLIGKLISDFGEEYAQKYFTETLLVSNEKTELCKICSKVEEQIIKKSTNQSFSLYISVPFCPSRCNYCSFVSHSVEQSKKLIPLYVEKLCEEIKETGKIANRIGLKLMTVYIGGGTPTTLSAEQLTLIMQTVRNHFDLSNLIEYTVEAGRPDTVTVEKLLAIKSGGATRISINPQTMNDDVLLKIGRRHTVEQTITAYNLARKLGFSNINTDLIAGLSGDSLESFKNSVDEIIKLNPENVTVHTLSMKRASNLAKLGHDFDFDVGKTAEQMVDYARNRLCEKGITPYYMYRQSKTVGNLENVGYSKAGYEGLYNIYIMDETHSILACGASAVTKLREPDGNFIDRVFNYKYPYEYINNFDEILNRKSKILSFYKEYGQNIWHNKD